MKVSPDFVMGCCCACGQPKHNVKNIICLPKKAPQPGTGWGCVVCGLDADGAVAVICNECLETQQSIRWAVDGYIDGGGRIEVEKLKGEHEHLMVYHRTELIKQ